MSTTAVILAGGKGTRSANPSLAKLAQEVDGASLMAWHLRLLEQAPVDEVLVVAGHLGDQVRALCDELNHSKVPLRVIQEERQEGTVTALRLAAEQTDSDEFLVILGDILMSFRVGHFLESWRASGKHAAVIVHPSTHPEDSDAAFPDHTGGVQVITKSQSRDHVPNMSSAGLFAISRDGLERYGYCKDFGSDILPAAAQRADLYGHVSSHYFKDTGTPSRLAAARADHESGAFHRRGDLRPRPALFLDRDGVINPALPEVYNADEYVLLPGVASAIGAANRKGVPVIVVTNQPGLAKGFMTFQAHERIRARMDRLLGSKNAFVDDYLFCPHHPDRGFVGEVAELKITCSCRKPDIALARDAADRHHVTLARSVMIGDTARDADFARSSGMKFIHVCDSCDLKNDHICVRVSADAITRGIEAMAC